LHLPTVFEFFHEHDFKPWPSSLEKFQIEWTSYSYDKGNDDEKDLLNNIAFAFCGPKAKGTVDWGLHSTLAGM
jgi:hypothetical protein